MLLVIFVKAKENVPYIRFQGWLEAMATGVAAGYHFCRSNFLSMKTFQVNKHLLRFKTLYGLTKLRQSCVMLGVHVVHIKSFQQRFHNVIVDDCQP